jgi:hypothetical protein
VTFTFWTHTPIAVKTYLSHGTKTKKKGILFRRKHHTNIRIDDNKCDDINSVGSGILHKVENMCMPHPLETWWKGTKCYPCSSVRVCVRTSVRKSLTSELLLVCLAKMKIQNIKINIKLGFGYNPLNFVEVMTYLKTWYILFIFGVQVYVIVNYISSSIRLQSTKLLIYGPFPAFVGVLFNNPW